MKDVLMSIKPQHVKNILDGAKTVELRRRAVSFSAGTKIWIYCTLPIGAIQLVATTAKIEINTPKYIWNKYANDMCIDGDEFFRYVYGAQFVSAISLTKIVKLKAPISLKMLRTQFSYLNPPQSYSYLNDLLLLETLNNTPGLSIELPSSRLISDLAA